MVNKFPERIVASLLITRKPLTVNLPQIEQLSLDHPARFFTDTRTTATNTTIPDTDITTTTEAFTIPSPTIEATITALVIDITNGGITTKLFNSPTRLQMTVG